MNKQIHNQVQALELKRLLEKVKGDPILEPQLKNRLKGIEQEIEKNPLTEADTELPRTAIFFNGGGVFNREGIKPSLAGEALIQYEKMYFEQSLFDERAAAKEAGRQKRPKGVSSPALLFTGTPRGSFGLEFVPVIDEDATIMQRRSKSLRTVTNSIALVANANEDDVDGVIDSLPPPILAPMKKFFKVIVKNEAEIRLAYPDSKPMIFKSDQLKIAYEHLEREVTEDEKEIRGQFRGLTLHSGHFDILTEDDEVISGLIAEEMLEQDRQTLYVREGQKLTFIVRITTITKKSGYQDISYTLVRAF